MQIWHRMHNRRTIRMALAAFKGNIYQNIYVPHHYKNIYKLKGLPNKTYSCMRRHWHRWHDFCVWKSIISRRIRGFSPWIRGPDDIVWRKNRRSKSRETVPFTYAVQRVIKHDKVQLCRVTVYTCVRIIKLVLLWESQSAPLTRSSRLDAPVAALISLFLGLPAALRSYI
jgi:hypothetical protein